MDSVLNYVKKNIGVAKDDKNFDPDIISHINGVLAILPQMCIPLEEVNSINDEYATWSDVLPSNDPKWEVIKTYVWLKVKLIFDPPLSQAHITAIKDQINECEWRISIMV